MNTAHNGGSSVDGSGQGRCVAFVTVDTSGEVAVFVVVVFLLVEVVGIITQHHALGKRGHAGHVSTVEDHGQFVAVNLLAGGDHRCTGFAISVDIGFAFFAQSDEHGFTAFGSHQGHGGVGLGLEIAISQHAVDLALERGRDTFNNFW